MKTLKFLFGTCLFITCMISCEVDSLEEEIELSNLETISVEGTKTQTTTIEKLEQENGTRTDGEDDNPTDGKEMSIIKPSSKIETAGQTRTDGDDDNPPQG